MVKEDLLTRLGLRDIDLEEKLQNSSYFNVNEVDRKRNESYFTLLNVYFKSLVIINSEEELYLRQYLWCNNLDLSTKEIDVLSRNFESLAQKYVPLSLNFDTPIELLKMDTSDLEDFKYDHRRLLGGYLSNDKILGMELIKEVIECFMDSQNYPLFKI